MADVGHGRDFDPLLPARQHDLKGRLIAAANVLLSGWALSRCRVPAVTRNVPGMPFPRPAAVSLQGQWPARIGLRSVRSPRDPPRPFPPTQLFTASHAWGFAAS